MYIYIYTLTPIIYPNIYKDARASTDNIMLSIEDMLAD